jgi:hypothetical protein
MMMIPSSSSEIRFFDWLAYASIANVLASVPHLKQVSGDTVSQLLPGIKLIGAPLSTKIN